MIEAELSKWFTWLDKNDHTSIQKFTARDRVVKFVISMTFQYIKIQDVKLVGFHE